MKMNLKRNKKTRRERERERELCINQCLQMALMVDFAPCLQPPAKSDAFVCTSHIFDRSQKKNPRWSLMGKPEVNDGTFPGEDF